MREVGKCVKISLFFFFFSGGGDDKNPEIMLINMFSLTFGDFGSLNGPLCANLVRQNLHNQTRPEILR